MNAIQFIQQHGVEKAREVVSGAPELAEYYSTIDGGYYRIEINAVNLKQLKRLVENVELVEVCGGLVEAKKKMNSESLRSATIEYVLYKAIADYESIGGEHV